MYYEINVAKMNEKTKRFEHYFATNKRSITTTDKAIEVGKKFKELFPFPEYDVTISYHSEGYLGTGLDAFLNDPKTFIL